jgi:hypothetical protein
MKTRIFVIFLLFIATATGMSQNIKPAPYNKAIVYFVRPSSYGFAINFSYFDSTRLIGKFNGPKYIRYECEPGTHLFWARSENKDFIDAEVDAGRIYFIEAKPHTGALKAEVELIPIDPKDAKTMKKVLELMDKKPSESFSEEELQKETEEMLEVIAKGLAKYAKDKEKGVVFGKLKNTMYYEDQSKVPNQ